MVDKILAFFSALPKELYIFVISMLPIIELRGAVPIGAILDLPFYLNFIISVIGNLIPVPFILLFIPKFLSFLERFKPFKPMVRWLRGKADKHKGKVLVDEESHANAEEIPLKSNDETSDDNPNRKMSKSVFFALMLFVALPLPGTGAWTGSLIASLFSLPKRKSFIAVTLGVLTCGVIMCLASYGVLGFLSFLL